MTLPLIHCVRNSSRSDRRFLKSIFGLNNGKEIDLEKVGKIVESTGSISFSMEKARAWMQKAISRLDDFEDSEYKTALAALCRFAVERDY